MNVLLRVSYRVRVHQMEAFERTLSEEVIPLAREFGIRCAGTWKTTIGYVGEYMELWEFDSIADFERSWPRFLSDPRLQAIFEKTEPMVDAEKFDLLQPLQEPVPPPASEPKEPWEG